MDVALTPISAPSNYRSLGCTSGTPSPRAWAKQIFDRTSRCEVGGFLCRLSCEAYPTSTRLFASTFDVGRYLMKFVKNTQPNRMRKGGKRVLLGETLEEEAARLEKEIAAHPVTRCEPGERSPSSSRPGWSSKPFIPLSERTVAEGIAKKMMRKKT